METYTFCQPRNSNNKMNHKVIFISALLTVLVFGTATIKAQNHIPDINLKRDFMAQVKSIDEFTARFNGDESKPGLTTENAREENIISLFDFRMSHQGLSDADFKKSILDFASAAATWDGRLSTESAGTQAEARCRVKYAGKNYGISLIMKMEKTVKGKLRWTISEVKGLDKLGLYNEKRLTISPVDHETHFMSLQDIFQTNRQLTPAMRSADKEIDDISFFFGMCVGRAIDFISVDKLIFCFSDVPGYAFTVEEIGRQGTNSGWLITELRKTGNDKNNE